MNLYDHYYLRMDEIRENIKILIWNMKVDDPTDKRIIYLMQAEDSIKKAMMKGTLYR